LLLQEHALSHASGVIEWVTPSNYFFPSCHSGLDPESSIFTPLKDQKIALLEQRVSNLEKENDLLRQQNAIQEKLTELAKRETEIYRTAFEKEKELTDRALKLAEIGKPKPNWELQGLLGMAVFLLGFLAGR
jgi:hypothetical protein